MINRMIRSVTDVVPHNTKRTIHNVQHCNRNVENVREQDISRECALQREHTCTRVPYGLASASSLFQRMMHTIFNDVKGVCYFQDDILIYANSQSEHDQILKMVLSKLRHHGLIVNKDK